MSLTHVVELFLVGMQLCCCSSAFSGENAPESTQDLQSKADSVLSQQTTRGRRDIGVVFRFADRLIEENRLQEAESYLDQGLALDSWNLTYQMKLAEVLHKLGKADAAKIRAELVLKHAETDTLVRQATQLLGMPAWAKIPEITIPEGTEHCIVLVPLQGSNRWILERMKTEITNTLGVPVTIMRLDMEMPKPARDQRGSILNSIGRAMGEHLEDPDLTASLKALKLNKDDLKNPENVLRIMKYILDQQGPQDFPKFKEELKKSIGLDPQWDVNEMVDIFNVALTPYKRKNAFFIGVTDSDIFSSDYRFLFSMGTSEACVVSYHRFTASFNQTLPQAAKVVERSLKASIWCSCYGFGLDQCSIPACPRAYANSLEEVDSRNAVLCPDCQVQLKEVIGSKPRHRESSR